jgi:hypothetical protein
LVNGKAKGGQYEREVARRLSKWISGGSREDLIWRSNSSGGQFSQKAKTTGGYSNQAGDLTSIDPMSTWFMDRFVVEIKTYKDLQVKNIIYRAKSKLIEFWDVHEELAKKVSKIPILIAKELRKPALILMPSEKCVIYNFEQAPFFAPGVLIYTLEEFLQENPYEEFKLLN